MMNKVNKRMILIVIALFLSILLLYLAKVFINHEKSQNERIELLRQNISKLNAEFQMQNTDIAWSEKGFNYLAIGNSITKHGICDYWWNECGMAATKEDNDYFHIVSAYIQDCYDDSVTYADSAFYTWEIQSADRAETLQILDRYLVSNLDLITVQLSENVTDLITFESDFEELLEYIKDKCPKSQVIVIDDFWDSEKSDIKRNITEKCGLDFADLSAIRENADYQCGLNTVVYDTKGEQHLVEHAGVARHPNDKGMEYIANQVIELIK